MCYKLKHFCSQVTKKLKTEMTACCCSSKNHVHRPATFFRMLNGTGVRWRCTKRLVCYLRGSGGMPPPPPPWIVFSPRMQNGANSRTFPGLSSKLQFPDMQFFISNSRTFPGFTVTTEYCILFTSRPKRTLNSKKYGVDLIRYTHAVNTALHCSTKVDGKFYNLSVYILLVYKSVLYGVLPWSSKVYVSNFVKNTKK